MFEEFANYIWVIIGIGGFTVFFWQFRKWNIEKLKQNNSMERTKAKQSTVVDQDIQQYINNPEEAIEVLKYSISHLGHQNEQAESARH